MGFFNDLSKKTSETTSKIARETKLKMKISENNGRIKELYESVGKKYYENRLKKMEDFEEQVEEDCTIIDQLAGEVEKARLEILGLNNKKLCCFCKAEMEKDAMFLIKANVPINTEAHSYVQAQMRIGRFKFLIDEQTAKVKLMSTKVGQNITPDDRNEYLIPFQ